MVDNYEHYTCCTVEAQTTHLSSHLSLLLIRGLGQMKSAIRLEDSPSDTGYEEIF
jgi:hypothetical protein